MLSVHMHHARNAQWRTGRCTFKDLKACPGPSAGCKVGSGPRYALGTAVAGDAVLIDLTLAEMSHP